MNERAIDRPVIDPDRDWEQPLWDVDGQPVNEEAEYIDSMETYAQALEAYMDKLEAALLRWYKATAGARGRHTPNSAAAEFSNALDALYDLAAEIAAREPVSARWL